MRGHKHLSKDDKYYWKKKKKGRIIRIGSVGWGLVEGRVFFSKMLTIGFSERCYLNTDLNEEI